MWAWDELNGTLHSGEKQLMKILKTWESPDSGMTFFQKICDLPVPKPYAILKITNMEQPPALFN